MSNFWQGKILSAILIVMLAFAVLPITPVYAATTTSDPISCTTGASPWTSPGNAVSSNDLRATVAFNNRNLDCSFNIVIPAGSTITNVEILPEGSTSNARQANVSISWNNGTNFSGTTLTTFTGTEGSITITPVGHSWTVAELTTILVRLNSNNGLGTLSIDNVAVRVTYTLPNTAPTVQSAIINVTVLEDAADTVFSLYPNFQDTESADAALTYTVTAISNTSLFTAPAGVLPIAIADPTNFTLDYAPNANGTSNVTIRATDPGGLFVEDTFQVTVTAVNDEPSFTAVNPVAVNEDAGAQTVIGWVTAVDFGPTDEDSSQAVSQYIISNSTCGTLLSAGPSVSTIGTLTYTPASNQNGTCTFDLQVQDNGGTANSGDDTSPTQNFTIIVNAVNDPSVAVDDTTTVTEDDTATTINVRSNDTDVEDTNTLEIIQSVTQPTNGMVVITNAGADLTYTPDADYCNDGTPTDDFTYTLAGGDTATVAVTVTCVDDASVANDDTATINEDSGATTIDVRANDTDGDSSVEAIQSVTQPANGTVGNFATNLTYEPNVNYCNNGTPTDNFTYTLAGGDTATVAVTVTCVDDASVAVDDTATVNEDSGATTINVRGNDTDADSTVEIIQSVTQPTNGTVSITNAGADLTYQPDADYCNDGTPTDDFTYTLAGGDTASVAVTVTCVDDASVANDDTSTVAEDSGATTINVRANDNDADSTVELIQSATQPTNGTVVNNGTDLSYQPDTDYCNDGSPTDDFTYTLAGGDSATVAVTVTCSGDASVANDDTAIVTEDDAATTIDVRGNDSDIDSAVQAIQSVTQPANGTVVNNGTDLTYQPDADYCNDGSPTDDFTYTLAGGDSATVTVTVTCVVAAPRVITNGINSNPDTGDGVVIENEIILDTVGITQFTVQFSEDVFNPAGDVDADDVTNPANYLLLRSTSNVFATPSCGNTPTVVAPDVNISVNSVTYSNGGGSGPFIATLNINSGLPLNVAGFYRLYVCGSTSIVDVDDQGIALAGDGTNPGTDFQRNFRIQASTSGGGGGGGDNNNDSSSTVSLSGVLIPVTGFAPNKITNLPSQPINKDYSASKLSIEIPSLGVNLPIVGIALKDKVFDVTWLGNNAGYLEGSAYPTLNGNTVLTSHVTDPNGNPGPFAYINELADGDKVYIHNNGFVYVYEVREIRRILPSSIYTVFKHKEDAWVTLVTCENYDVKSNKFTHRRIVRAVLISIIPEK